MFPTNVQNWPATFTWITSAFAQIGIIFLVAATFQWLLSKRSAQTRHQIWWLALAAMALVLPMKWAAQDLAFNIEISKPQIVDVTSIVSPTESPDFDLELASLVDRPAGDTFAATPSEPTINLSHTSPPLADTAKRRLQPFHWFALSYIVVLLFALTRIALGLLRLNGAIRSGRVPNPKVLDLTRECCEAIGLRRVARVYVSPAVQNPLVFGIFRPTVLLPESFVDWTQPCQRSVLMHELVHVARRDGLTDLVSQLIKACYWFHPAVYFSIWMLRREREQATDERVVLAGIDPLKYASHLVGVLRNSQSHRSVVVGAAMSHFGDTESRVKRILSLDVVSPKQSRFACCMALGLFVAIGVFSVRFVSAQPPAVTETKPPTANDPKPTTPNLAAIPQANAVEEKLIQVAAPIAAQTKDPNNFFEAISSCQLAQKRDPNYVLTVRGVVTNANGEGVAGAVVALRQANPQYGFHHKMDLVDDVFARTTTDAMGNYEFKDIAARWFSPISLGYFKKGFLWDVVAAANDGGVGWQHLEPFNAGQTYVKTVHIELKNTTEISGVYADESGTPLSGAVVQTHRLDIADLHEDQRKPERLNLHLSSITPRTRTDENGRFSLRGIPPNLVASIFISHPDWELKHSVIRTSPNVRTGPRQLAYLAAGTIVASGEKHLAMKGFPIKGVVRDSAGKGVPNASIVFNEGLLGAKTDAEGAFEHRLSHRAFARNGRERDVRIRVFIPTNERGLISKRFVLTKQQAKKGKLDIEVETGTLVSGHVASADGNPIESMRVIAVPLSDFSDPPKPGSRLYSSGTTKEDGSFELYARTGDYELVPIGPNPEYSTARSTGELLGHSPASRSWAPTATIRVGNETVTADPIIVKPRTKVEVRCVDDSGSAISNVDLAMFHLPVTNSTLNRISLAESVTDENGYATLKPRRSFPYGVYVRSTIQDGDKRFWSETLMSADPTGSLTTIVMKPMVRVFGKVTVDDGPINGTAEVTLQAFRNGTARYKEVQCDSDGNYSGYVVPGANYTVRLSHINGQRNNSCPPHATHQVSANEFQAEDIRTVMAHETISGRVTEQDGTPVEGMRVTARPHGYELLLPANPSRITRITTTDAKGAVGYERLLLANPSRNTRIATTDAKGAFRIDGLPKGNYRVSALSIKRPRSHFGTSTAANTGDTDVKITVLRSPDQQPVVPVGHPLINGN